MRRWFLLAAWGVGVGALAASGAMGDRVVVSRASFVSPLLAEALRAGEHDAALTALAAVPARSLSGAQTADRAFLVAWEAAREGQVDTAKGLLSQVQSSPLVSTPEGQVLHAELLRALGRGTEALAWPWPSIHEALAPRVRSRLVHAELLRDAGRTSEARDILEATLAWPDPTPGMNAVLHALIVHRGAASPGSRALVGRLATAYPASPEGVEAMGWLEMHHPRHPLTAEERLVAGRAWLDEGNWTVALEVTRPIDDQIGRATEASCGVAYVRGQALYKRNDLTDALALFDRVGDRCAGLPDGEKIRYLEGTAASRMKRYDRSATAFVALAVEHPDTSYADDGLTRAGIAELEAGHVEAALALWARALASHPDGDTVPEAAFRLAFTRYEQGDTAAALAVVDTLATRPPAVDEVHIAAARYWAARWRAYPDVSAPTVRTRDAAAWSDALQRWQELVVDAPMGWYGALAAARLGLVAPERMAGVPRLAVAADTTTWHVDTTATDRVAPWLALGLVDVAQASWPGEVDDAGTMGWWIESRARVGDWLVAHQELHRWIREHPLGSLPAAVEPALVRVAYPDRYWTEVRAATAAFAWDPRLLHALSREESTFDKDIVSFAGARGLAQLMPATAREVGERLGLRVSRDDLFEPSLNLTLGGAYLDRMLERFGGDPALALAAYNAGPGNVGRWLDAHGARPLDEFVERIPFRETRGYVKRVTGTWQTMRHAFDRDRPPFVELGPYLDQVVPTP